VEEGGAEIADANKDDGLEAGGAEGFREARAEGVNIVAEAARAELAEVGQVLAELRGLDAGCLCEGSGGDRGDAVGLEALEAAVVEGKTVNRFPGDGLASHG
jgi:hypothetical protein